MQPIRAIVMHLINHHKGESLEGDARHTSSRAIDFAIAKRRPFNRLAYGPLALYHVAQPHLQDAAEPQVMPLPWEPARYPENHREVLPCPTP